MGSGIDIFNMAKWLIMASGSWRLELEGKTRFFYRIYEIYFRVIYLSLELSVIINMCLNIGVDNDKAIELLSMVIHGICSTIKLILSMSNKVTKLIRMAVQDDAKLADNDPELREMLRWYNKYVNILSIIMVSYSYYISFQFCIIDCILEYRKYYTLHPNATANPVHLISIWLPFDIEKHFHFALGLQFFIGIQSVPSIYSCLVLFNTLMVYAVIKLKILQHHFKNFDSYSGENEGENRMTKDAKAIASLKRLVKQHQVVIKFVQELNDSVKFALLIEYNVSSLMLASVLLQILNGNKVFFFVLYGLVLTFQLFLLSWNADEIKSESGNIANALYESNWYIHSPNVRRYIIFIMMRSRRELSLNIGPFGPNNLNAAMSRMKLAYSYVSVMSGNSF